MQPVRRLIVAFSLGLALFSPACAHGKVTPETPVAAAALKADAVVIRVNELQSTVIDACGPATECQPGSLPTATARAIVQTCIDLRTTLKAVSAGWQATVKTAWAQAQSRFVSVTNPAVLAALALVQAAVEGL